MFAEVTLENLHDVASRGCVSYTAANNVTGAARLTHVFGSLAQILPEHGPEDYVINVLDDEAWNMYNQLPPRRWWTTIAAARWGGCTSLIQL